MANKPLLRERDIMRIILDYLKVHRIFHFRLNTGAFKAAYNGKQRLVRFGTLGAPDIVAIINGRFVAIEVKGPEGFQSQHQVEFQHECEKAGGVYVLARSVEDVQFAHTFPDVFREYVRESRP